MSDFDARIEDLFNEALDLPREQRNAFVEQATADQPAVRKAVLALLQHESDMPSSFMAGEATQAASAAPAPVFPSAVPEAIGDYRVLSSIGSGGMGVIYEAEQQSPRRRVALKVIRPGLVSDEVVRRFRHEAQILGYLQHPGIAQIYEAQVASVGGAETPFLAMELIRGERIDAYVRARHFDTNQTIELAARVCDAVHHAHQKGVLHRDLKPSNILVTEVDSSMMAGGVTGSSVVQTDAVGQPKVLDFGVARVTDADLQVETMQTQEGQIIGTLSYMSPEQVSGANEQVDTRSDVYALGVLLFELLTGKLPFDLHGVSFLEAARRIKEEAPLRAGTLIPALRGDLDTILQKALDRDPDRRYSSAADLAADLRRYLRHEPVLARPPSLGYQVSKFASRNRALVAGAVSTIVVLVLGIIGTGIGWVSTVRALDELQATNTTLQTTNAALEQTRDDLEDIAVFQADQLASVDVPQMGTRLREAVLASISEDEQAAMDELLRSVNFADLARDTVRDNILLPSYEVLEEDFADQPAVHARLLQSLARTLREIGAHNAALPIQEEAVAIRRETLGETAYNTRYSISQLGNLKQAIGDLDGAEQAFREVLELSQGQEGRPRDAAVDVGNLGQVLDLQGRTEEAEPLLMQAYEAAAAHEETEGSRLSAAAALASMYSKKGQLDEAQKYYDEVIEGRTRLFGSDHHQTLLARTSLGVHLGRHGNYEEAEKILSGVLKDRIRIFGESHPSTIVAFGNLCQAFEQLSRFEEAEAHARRALELAKDVLGPYHAQTLNALNSLAAILDARGNFDEAEAIYADSLARHEKVLGPDDPSTLKAVGNYGYILSLQQRQEEALPYYQRSVDGQLALHGEEHPSTLTAIGNLAVLLSKLGRMEEAQPYYLRSLEGRRKLLGPTHPSTVNAIYNMGYMLVEQGKFEEAEPYSVDALRLYRELAGEKHIGTLYSFITLGELRKGQERYEEALELFNQAREGWESIHGPDHVETIAGYERVAWLLEDMEQFEEAEQIWTEQLEAAERREETPRWGTIEALRNLSGCLLGQDRWEEAEDLITEALQILQTLEDAEEYQELDLRSQLAFVVSNDPERVEQAEETLIATAERMAEIAAEKPSQNARLAKLRGRLVRLYERLDRAADADRWRD